MIRRSPSRNHRSKGIKVKHVLQIILLLGICFWLIYQVKHSHDKKKEFDESNRHVSDGTQTENQIPKLGRKDLRPRKDEVNQNEKHEEEVEDENIDEEDENKHELSEQEEEGNEQETDGKEDGKPGGRGGGEEEQEEDENKNEEMEDERGGDDEIDENDQTELDTDRDEFVDEEKEKEESDEKDSENTEDEEKEGSVENHHTHEAREVHYKGDDASSAVTHDTHTTSTETETVNLENSDDNSEKSIMKSESKPNYTEESSWASDHTDSNIKVEEVELTTGGTSNATSGIETGNNSLSNPVYSSHLNGTATTHSDTHSEASSNLTIANPGVSNNKTQTDANTSSEQNKMGIFSESGHAQNDTKNTTATVDVKNVQTVELQRDGNSVSEEHPDSNATATIETENGNAAAGESASLESGGLEKTASFVASNETENKNNSFMKDNTDATGNEKLKGDTQTGETGESSESSSTGNETANSIDHKATDSNDSHILKDVTETHTDPGTLPGIRNEGDDSGKTATE